MSKSKIAKSITVNGIEYHKSDIKQIVKENQAFKNVFKRKFGVTDQELNNALAIKVETSTKTNFESEDSSASLPIKEVS